MSNFNPIKFGSSKIISNIINSFKSIFGANKPSISTMFKEIVSSPSDVDQFVSSLPLAYNKDEIDEGSKEMLNGNIIHGNLVDDWTSSISSLNNNGYTYNENN